MNHDHVTTWAVADPGDGCARGARGIHAAHDPTGTPPPSLILSRDS
ncbi:hypothetical protein [Candidatus Palauibacter sp.]